MIATDIILPWNKPITNLIPETDIVLTLAANNLQKNSPSIMENYVNIRYQTDFYNRPFASFVGDHSEWYRFKFLSVQSIPHWMINPKNLKDLVFEALSHRNYIFCNVNTKYIHNYKNYKKQDCRHSISIYGLCNDQLSICDYFDYRVRQNGVCSISEFSAALSDYMIALNENRAPFFPNLEDHLNGILLFKEKNNVEGIELSKILFELRSFINPNTLLQKDQKISYGIHFFRVFCNYLADGDIYHSQKNYSKFLQLIFSHTSLMEMRARFVYKHCFDNHQRLTNEFKDLTESARTIRNGYLKALLSKNNDTSYHKLLSSKIYEFYQKYQETLQLLVDNLEAFPCV